MAFIRFVPLICFVVLLSAVAAKDAICSGKFSGEWLADPTDCTSVLICFNEKGLRYKCPQDTVWNPSLKICVAKGSDLDVCDKKNKTVQEQAPVHIHVPCSVSNVVREPHETSCSKYYECPQKSEGSDGQPILKECPYPLLFDEDSNTCQFPKRSKCTRQVIPKDPCEYEENKCKSVMCVPCKMRMPSCKGLPDGVNVWTGKLWTSNYIVCEQERVVFSGLCELNTKGVRKLFNPEKKSCVETIVFTFPS